MPKPTMQRLNSAVELDRSRLHRDRFDSDDAYLLADWLKEIAVQLAAIREAIERRNAFQEAGIGSLIQQAAGAGGRKRKVN